MSLHLTWRREGKAGDIRNLSVSEKYCEDGSSSSSQRVSSADHGELVSPSLRSVIVGKTEEVLRLEFVVDVLCRLNHPLQHCFVQRF